MVVSPFILFFLYSSQTFAQKALTIKQERKLNSFLRSLGDSETVNMRNYIELVIEKKLIDSINRLAFKTAALQEALAIISSNQRDSINSLNTKISVLTKTLNNTEAILRNNSITIDQLYKDIAEKDQAMRGQEFKMTLLKDSLGETLHTVSLLQALSLKPEKNGIDSNAWLKLQEARMDSLKNTLLEDFNHRTARDSMELRDVTTQYESRETVLIRDSLKSRNNTLLAVTAATLLAVIGAAIIISKRIKERKIIANAKFEKCRIINVKDNVLLADVLVDEKEKVIQLRKFETEPIRQAIGDVSIAANTVFEIATITLKGKKIALYRKGKPADASTFEQIYEDKIRKLGK
jgi:hypothetical protein